MTGAGKPFMPSCCPSLIKMRILFVAPSYYPRIGGVEYVVKSVATRLVKRGHEVTVLCGDPDGREPVKEVLEGVEVIRWPTIAPGNAYHVPRERGRFWNLLEGLAKKFDVAHVHSAHAVVSVESGLRLKRVSPGIGLVFTLHYHGTGHTLLRRVFWGLYWRRKVAELVRLADAVHAVSPHEAELVKAHYPWAREKLVVIPNGVDEDLAQREWVGEGSDYMMYAGRIEKYKRLELAVEAAKRLGLRLLIVGRGPHEGPLRRYATKSYPGGVEFMPPLPRGDYVDRLTGARYAINPSEREAFGLFIAEALVIGVPSIVSANAAKALGAETNELPALEGLDELVLVERAEVRLWPDTVAELEELYESVAHGMTHD